MSTTMFNGPILSTAKLHRDVAQYVADAMAVHGGGSINVRFGDDTEQDRRWATVEITSLTKEPKQVRTKPKLPIVDEARTNYIQQLVRTNCFLCDGTGEIMKAKSGGAEVMRSELPPGTRFDASHFESAPCPLCAKKEGQ